MKQTMLALLLVSSFAATAENIVPVRSATLRSCEAGLLGCRASIEYEGQSVQLNVGSLPEPMFNSYGGTDVSLSNIEGFVRSTEQHPGTFRDEFYLVTSDQSAEISICDVSLMGCAPRITVNGEDVLLDRTGLSDSVNRRLNPAGVGGSLNASVKGYFAYERGHFPNPTAYFRVFKVLEINISDSAIIEDSGRENGDAVVDGAASHDGQGAGTVQ